MLKVTNSFKTVEKKTFAVKVETEVFQSGIGPHLVGLDNSQTRQSLLRIITALQSKNYHIPGKKIIINITPADLGKKAEKHDLAIAVTTLAASGQINAPGLEEWLVVGELALCGDILPVDNIKQAIALAKKKHYKGCVIPRQNYRDIIEDLDEEIPVYGAMTLDEAVAILEHPESAENAQRWYVKHKFKPGQDVVVRDVKNPSAVGYLGTYHVICDYVAVSNLIKYTKEGEPIYLCKSDNGDYTWFHESELN